MRRHAIRGIGRRLLNGLAVIIGGFAGAIAVTFAAMFAFQETMGAAVAVLVYYLLFLAFPVVVSCYLGIFLVRALIAARRSRPTDGLPK
jgi:hypothetical protein